MRIEKKALAAAARDTLMNTAGVSGIAPKDLQTGHSLAVDIGFDYSEFKILAEYKCGVGHRLGRDGKRIAIHPDELCDHMVWQVYSLTVEHAAGLALGAMAIAELFAQSQAELRIGIGSDD